jgi:predicted MFS family arabinose efflux permease
VRAVFWVASIPAFLAVALLFLFLKEPKLTGTAKRENPISRAKLSQLPTAYWGVVGLGAVFSLARFSEAFLLLRAQDGGMPLAFIPLVLVAMNLVYALTAYPFGKLSDRMTAKGMLMAGLAVLVGASFVSAHFIGGTCQTLHLVIENACILGPSRMKTKPNKIVI